MERNSLLLLWKGIVEDVDKFFVVVVVKMIMIKRMCFDEWLKCRKDHICDECRLYNVKESSQLYTLQQFEDNIKSYLVKNLITWLCLNCYKEI